MGRHMYFAKLGGAARVIFPGTGPSVSRGWLRGLRASAARGRRPSGSHLKPFFGVMRLDAITQLHGGAIQEETHPCGLGERYRQSRTRDPLSPKPAAPLHRNYTEALKGSRQQRPQLGGKNRNYRVLGPGGRKRNRTAVRGFAVLCIATLPSGRLVAAYRRAPRNWSRTPDGVWHIAHALVAGRRCAPYIG
jgi:hypothetical protein